MLLAIGADAAREALSALESHVAAFDPMGASEAQRRMIRSECDTIRRRLSAVEREAARERRETAALGGERESYLRAAAALRGRGDQAAGDRGQLTRAAAATGERLAAGRVADAETAEWLLRVRKAVEALVDAAGVDAPGGAGGTQPVLRSLGRVGAMLGTMLGEAETRRGGG
jgi:hypothetical protein